MPRRRSPCIEATIDPFRGLLLGLFFIAIGARLDLRLLFDGPIQILSILVAFVAVKVVVLYLLMARAKMPSLARHEIAWLLAPGGEFAFVLLSEGMGAGLVWPSVGGQMMVAVTLSMFLIPLIATVLDRLAKASSKAPAAYDEVQLSEAGRGVVIVGCGRVGTLVAEMLASHKVPAFGIDTNPRNVAMARAEGLRAYYGDLLVPQFMARLGLDSARALVLTLNNPTAVETIVRSARAAYPHLTIVARARDSGHAQRLYELGVTDAVPETFEASLQLAESVLVDVGVPMGLVIASVHDQRDKTRKMLKEASGKEVRVPQAVVHVEHNIIGYQGRRQLILV